MIDHEAQAKAEYQKAHAHLSHLSKNELIRRYIDLAANFVQMQRAYEQAAQRAITLESGGKP
jgi:hypothetical protein